MSFKSCTRVFYDRIALLLLPKNVAYILIPQTFAFSMTKTKSNRQKEKREKKRRKYLALYVRVSTVTSTPVVEGGGSIRAGGYSRSNKFRWNWNKSNQRHSCPPVISLCVHFPARYSLPPLAPSPPRRLMRFL